MNKFKKMIYLGSTTSRNVTYKMYGGIDYDECDKICKENPTDMIIVFIGNEYYFHPKSKNYYHHDVIKFIVEHKNFYFYGTALSQNETYRYEDWISICNSMSQEYIRLLNTNTDDTMWVPFHRHEIRK